MNAAASIATWDVLQDFGFEPDDEVIYDESSGLSFDFGDFKLSAACVVNMWLREIVLFSGVLATQRTLAELSFELPRRVKSREQCAALIVYYLDRSAPGSVFIPAREAGWVLEGRQNKNLLPWFTDMAAYDARPHCEVRRDWLRVALKTLGALLDAAEDEAEVSFGFDDAVLTIRCAGKVVALPAEGRAWPRRYTIPAGSLRNLPKRLMQETLIVSIWKGQLTIGRNIYSGVVAAASGEETKTINA